MRKLNNLANLEENVIVGNCLKIPDASRATLVLGVDEAVLRVNDENKVFPVIHGQFPKYEQVLPQTWHNKIRIKSADFRRLIDEIKPQIINILTCATFGASFQPEFSTVLPLPHSP